MWWFYNHPWLAENPGRPESTRALVIPPSTSVSRLQVAANRCVARFEALRTVYSKPGAQPPQQKVLASYEPPLLKRDDEYVAGASLFERPSLRFLVRTAGETVVDAKLRINKLDVDGYALSIVKGLIEQELDPDRQARPVEFNGDTHPIDWAIGEAERLGRDGSRSIEWMRELRQSAPRNVMPLRKQDGVARQRTVAVVLASGLLHELEQLAKACRVTTAAVLHTAVAVLLAAWTREPAAFLHTVLANRWERETRNMVGRVAMAAACRIPVDRSLTARELLGLTGRVLLSAYRHASRDFDECRMAGIRDDAEYGSASTLPVVVEYHGYLGGQPDGRAPRDTVHGTVHDGGVDEVRFDIAPAMPDLTLAMTVDTCRMSATDTEAALRAMVELLRGIARQPDVSVSELMRRVELPAPDQRGLVALAGGRFSADLIRQCLRGHDGVGEAAVFLTDGPSPVRAHLVGSPVDLPRLHEHVLLAAARDALIRVPTSYRLVGSAPEDPTCEGSWLRRTAVAELSPRDGYRPSAPDERVRALARVFEDCHPGASWDPALCYAQAGGRYVMVPAMMVGLRQAGYAGAEPADFISLASLAAIAGKLTPTSAPLTGGVRPPAAAESRGW
jgi:hypothetical protein